MNALELADKQAFETGELTMWIRNETATMLRQQQAEIEALKAKMSLSSYDDAQNVAYQLLNEKISLWDYFAANALQGLIAGCYSGNNVGFTVEGNVFAAYEYADAMMKARNK